MCSIATTVFYVYRVSKQEVINNFKRKQYRNKSKKQVASIQLEIAILHQPALATVSSNIFSKMHVQIKYSLAYLQDLVLILPCLFAYLF